jgi:hypothetical protein
MGAWVLRLGLVESGEYEEGLELCRPGTAPGDRFAAARLAARHEQAERHDEAGDAASCCGESEGDFRGRTLLKWS